MKAYKLLSITVVIAVALTLAFLTGVPASAGGPVDEPTTDKIVPDLFPLLNTLNPDSPYYDPSDAYGGEGTRFGPPGKRGPDLPELSSLQEEPGVLWIYHNYWGTALKSGATKTGARAKQYVFTTITLKEWKDTLYAPTLLPPNYCPLESVTYYYKTLTGMQRKWKVYDHYLDAFKYSTNINATFLDNYVRNGYYWTKVEKMDSEWWASLYNYNYDVWEAKWAQTNPGDYSEGWDVWEEYDLNNNWPTLPEIDSFSLQVNVGGYWKNVNSTYGYENNYLPPDFPYDYGWNVHYYDWYVGPGP